MILNLNNLKENCLNEIVIHLVEIYMIIIFLVLLPFSSQELTRKKKDGRGADPCAGCTVEKNPHAQCTSACKGGARVHEFGHAPPLLTLSLTHSIN